MSIVWFPLFFQPWTVTKIVGSCLMNVGRPVLEHVTTMSDLSVTLEKIACDLVNRVVSVQQDWCSITADVFLRISVLPEVQTNMARQAYFCILLRGIQLWFWTSDLNGGTILKLTTVCPRNKAIARKLCLKSVRFYAVGAGLSITDFTYSGCNYSHRKSFR